MDQKKELIGKLQQDILFWQGFKPGASNNAESMGLGMLESAFPNGVFPRKAIHEFISLTPEHVAASEGFIAGLLATLMKDGAACIWISTSRKLFPVALHSFNVDPERVIFMDVSKEQDALWIMEEALKCEGLAAVVAELDDLGLIESRRMQLAVEQTGVTGFILRKASHKTASNIATARWKITPLPSAIEDGMPGVGFPRWQVELQKVRNGNPGSWTLEWAGDRFAEAAKIQESTLLPTVEERQIS